MKRKIKVQQTKRRTQQRNTWDMLKTKAKRSEDDEQIAVMQWARLQNYKDGKVADYLHHSPNGGSRNVIEASKFKRMGVMKGFPDLFLFVPNGGYHGLLIELKAENGRLQPTQKIVLNRMAELGYCCKVCFGADQAIGEIKNYLGLGV